MTAGLLAQRALLVVVLAASVFALTGCGAGRQAGTSSTDCSSAGADCAREPLASQMAQNRAYRDHASLAPSATAAAQPTVDQVRTGLQPFSRTKHPTEAGLRLALVRLGFDDAMIQTGGLGFGIEASGGCIDGVVRPGSVTARFEGFVGDGGCIALIGH